MGSAGLYRLVQPIIPFPVLNLWQPLGFSDSYCMHLGSWNRVNEHEYSTVLYRADGVDGPQEMEIN